ncbi:unnamed protein product [Schistosoma margrebowiei]|uniref:Uncharacterized protein n=1 Tax=Schistosoma margrebowiei TaxID=48269 RepID=A0A183LU60_9TREM|nr:unnamed protein product [Schistosoma margrebowiei]
MNVTNNVVVTPAHLLTLLPGAIPPESTNYFYGKITREQAEELLFTNGANEGLFLLRESVNRNYAVSICHLGRVHHYNVERQTDCSYRIQTGFLIRTYLVMQSDDLRNVCPIHFHRLFLISSSSGNWFILSHHRRMLLMVSDQWMLSILREQLFINTCTLLMMVAVVLHVSDLYSRTDCLDVRIEDCDFDIG